ncbi:MAG: ABC transporter permease [bacterium]|nr:ABC transporter permease [bacterium]
MRSWDLIRRHKAGNIAIVFVLIQALCIGFALALPERFPYLTENNVQVMLKRIPPLAVMAVGVGMLMIAGEFDLSVGSIFVFSSFVMAKVYNTWVVNPFVAALLALVVGGLIGLLNGVIVIRAQIPSFIATLGTMWFWRGANLFFSGSVTEPFLPTGFFRDLFCATLGPEGARFMQAQFLWLFAVLVLGYLTLERHRFGNHLFATGGNRQSAIAIGVNPNKVKVIAFVIVGVLAAFSGILATVRVESVSPVQGQGMELMAIAACVIGGLSLTGGEGTILGIFLGTALLFTIEDVLLLLGAPGDYLQGFIGVLIILAVIFNRITRKE